MKTRNFVTSVALVAVVALPQLSFGFNQHSTETKLETKKAQPAPSTPASNTSRPTVPTQPPVSALTQLVRDQVAKLKDANVKALYDAVYKEERGKVNPRVKALRNLVLDPKWLTVDNLEKTYVVGHVPNKALEQVTAQAKRIEEGLKSLKGATVEAHKGFVLITFNKKHFVWLGSEGLPVEVTDTVFQALQKSVTDKFNQPDNTIVQKFLDSRIQNQLNTLYKAIGQKAGKLTGSESFAHRYVLSLVLGNAVIHNAIAKAKGDAATQRQFNIKEFRELVTNASRLYGIVDAKVAEAEQEVQKLEASRKLVLVKDAVLTAHSQLPSTASSLLPIAAGMISSVFGPSAAELKQSLTRATKVRDDLKRARDVAKNQKDSASMRLRKERTGAAFQP